MSKERRTPFNALTAMLSAAEPQHAAGRREEVVFPASAAQQAFWYLESLSPGMTAFNVPVRFRLDGPLDPRLLEQSLRTIVERHEILRTHFEESDGGLLQVVEPDSLFRLEFADTGGGPDAGEEADRLARAEASKPFTLTRAPLFRAVLVRLSEDSHMLHVTAHHAVFDGWSIRVLTTELGRLYEALHAGLPCPLAPLPIQYGDYTVWQNDFLDGPEVASQLAHWTNRLADLHDLELPSDRPRPRVKSWRGDIVSTLLPKELTTRLASIATSHAATLFHLYIAAFMAVANRYTGAEDIAIGVPVAGRNKPELEDLIGSFINTVLVRSNLAGNPPFAEFLGRVSEAAVEALEHQDVPFEVLVRALRPGREPGRNPLFQINFTHQRSFARAGTVAGVALTPVPSVPQGAIFDVNIFMVERKEGWRASCDFSTDLFDRPTIERMLRHFQTILDAIARDPFTAIQNLPMVPRDELDQIDRWSEAPTTYPDDATIAELFTEVAAAHPEQTAVLHRECRVAYRELQHSAACIAHDLQSRGIKPGMFVGIAAEPTPERVAGLLGIAMAGAAYAPLDPAAPAAWNKAILQDAGISCVLADDSAKSCFPEGSVVPLPPVTGEGSLQKAPAPCCKSSDPAYLVFTSGSTGEPKGVIVPHKAVVRLVRGTNFMGFGVGEVFLQASPLTFDAATFEIWGALLNGGTLAIPDLPMPGIPEITRAIQIHKVTTLWLTAGLFQVVIEECPQALRALRNLLAGGDVLPAASVARAREYLPGVRLINGYGPTENTTFTTCHTIREEDCARTSIPIGVPIANTRVRIVDQAGRTVPIGIPGELHVGGDGLAIGYLNDPVLTAEKFITTNDGLRWYRTGDRARWLADGAIEFLGRMDSQLKIRGFRVEPAEVEAALLRIEGITGVKVAARGREASGRQLVAWISGRDGTPPDVSFVARTIAAQLPRHLCPDAIVPVKAFPLTPNGKIDTKALPDVSAVRVQAGESDALQTGTERRLAAIWSELTGTSNVRRSDDFFKIGGHSLLAIRVFERIRRDLGPALPLSSLLQDPSLAGIAALIDKAMSPTPHTEERPSFSLIARVQTEGSRPPFVCIHGGDGGIIFYRDLAPHLEKDRPFWAIEAPTLNQAEPVTAEPIEQMAEKYLSLLRSERGDGPFLLGGYSFGGLVAFEMACLLAKDGMQVPLLVLFDTSNPAVKGRMFTPRERLLRACRLKSGNRLSVRAAHLLKRALSRVRVSDEEEQKVLRDPRHEEICAAHLQAMRAYRPGFYPGKLTLFKAAEQDPFVKLTDDYGWSAAASEVEITRIPGCHMTLFETANVAVLGHELRTRLAKIDDGLAVL